MSSKLKGRDVNGMRSGQWGKLDTSSIEAPKLGAKATNEDLCNAVKEMLVASVIALYGDPTQKKYVKIVDMLMLRVRGALAELNEQAESKAEEYNKSLNKVLEDLAESFSKTIENHDKSIDEARSDKLKKLYEAIESKIDEFNGQKQQKNANGSETSDSATSQTIESTVDKKYQSASSITHEQNSSSSNTVFDLLLDLQKQIADNFSKIESLITNNAVQKSAENAIQSTQKPIEKEIVNRQKNSEKEVKSQISNLNSKTGIDIAKKQTQENGKESKEDKKRKKNDLKDVMTGKQFDLLKKLLQRQFFDVVDISDAIVKKVNRGFKDINKRLDKLIKDREKNSFSWIKFLLIASFFLFPAIWAKILRFTRNVLMPAVMTAASDLLDWIDQTFNINALIDSIITNIDWETHVKNIGEYVWNAIKGSFNMLIGKPFDWAYDAVSNVFHSCVDWISDLWDVVTGAINGKEVVKKRKDFEDKQIKASEKRIEQTVSSSCSKTEKHFDDTGKLIERTSQKSVDNMKNSTDKANAAAQQGKEKIESEFNKTVQKNNEVNVNLKSMSDAALANVRTLADSSLTRVNKKIEDVTVAHAQNIERTANATVKDMQQNGPPTNVKLDQIESADAMMEQNESVQIEAPKISTGIDSLQNVQAYTRVNLDKVDEQTGARSYIVEKDELQQRYGEIDPGNHSLMVERLRNRMAFGKYADNSAILREKKMKAHEKYLAQRRQLAFERDEYAEKITSEQTSESEVEREARLYDNVNQGFTAVVQNSKLIEDGLTKNNQILNSISMSVKEYFSQLNEYVNDAQNTKKTDGGVGIAVFQGSPGAQNNNEFDAGMSNS